jgi:hypothetical protein
VFGPQRPRPGSGLKRKKAGSLGLRRISVYCRRAFPALRKFPTCRLADCQSAPADGTPHSGGLETRGTADQRSALPRLGQARLTPPPVGSSLRYLASGHQASATGIRHPGIRHPGIRHPSPLHSAGQPAHSRRFATNLAHAPRASSEPASPDSIRHPVSGIRHQPSGIRCPASGVRLLSPHSSLLTSNSVGRRGAGAAHPAADREGAGLDGVSPHRRVLRPGRSPALPDCAATQRGSTARQRLECGRLLPLSVLGGMACQAVGGGDLPPTGSGSDRAPACRRRRPRRQPCLVAQVSNLPYHRLPVGPGERFARPRRVGNPRDSRPEVCATSVPSAGTQPGPTGLCRAAARPYRKHRQAGLRYQGSGIRRPVSAPTPQRRHAGAFQTLRDRPGTRLTRRLRARFTRWYPVSGIRHQPSGIRHPPAPSSLLTPHSSLLAPHRTCSR